MNSPTSRRTLLPLLALTGFSMWLGKPLLAQEEEASSNSLVFVDLQADGNRNLADDQHGFEGNNLSELQAGVHAFAGVNFKISEKCLSLGSTIEKHYPHQITGIKLDRTATRLHFLHGTGYGNAGGPVVADNTLIGEYVIHFADNTTASVPVEYGKDVRDWWTWGQPFAVSRGKVAWTGQNPFSRTQKQKIYLYLETWENPKPDVKILSIDYTSTATTAAAPFCVAITAEAK